MPTANITVYLIFLLVILGCENTSDTSKVMASEKISDTDASLSNALNAFRPLDVSDEGDDDDKKEAELMNCKQYQDEIWSSHLQTLRDELLRREKIDTAILLHFHECSYKHSVTVADNQLNLKRTYWIKARTTSWEFYVLKIVVNTAVDMQEITTVSLKKNHNENFVIELRCTVGERCLKQKIESIVVLGLIVTDTTKEGVSLKFPDTVSSLQLITEKNYDGFRGDSLEELFEKYKNDHNLRFNLDFSR